MKPRLLVSMALLLGGSFLSVLMVGSKYNLSAANEPLNSSSSPYETVKPLLDAAESAYSSGEYSLAAARYTEALEQGLASARAVEEAVDGLRMVAGQADILGLEPVAFPAGSFEAAEPNGWSFETTRPEVVTYSAPLNMLKNGGFEGSDVPISTPLAWLMIGDEMVLTRTIESPKPFDGLQALIPPTAANEGVYQIITGLTPGLEYRFRLRSQGGTVRMAVDPVGGNNPQAAGIINEWDSLGSEKGWNIQEIRWVAQADTATCFILGGGDAQYVDAASVGLETEWNHALVLDKPSLSGNRVQVVDFTALEGTHSAQTDSVVTTTLSCSVPGIRAGRGVLVRVPVAFAGDFHPDSVKARVGVNLNGDTNPDSAATVWTDPVSSRQAAHLASWPLDNTDKAKRFRAFFVSGQADADSITIHIQVTTNTKHWDANRQELLLVDDVKVYQSDAPAIRGGYAFGSTGEDLPLEAEAFVRNELFSRIANSQQPNRGWAAVWQAQALQTLGRFEHAKNALKPYEELPGELGQWAKLQKGLGYYHVQDHPRARKLLEEVSNTENSEPLIKVKAKIRLAHIALQSQKTEDARRLLTDVIESPDANREALGVAHFLMGVSYFRNNQFLHFSEDSADLVAQIDHFNEAIQGLADRPRVLIYESHTYAAFAADKSGNRQLAMSFLEPLLDATPSSVEEASMLIMAFSHLATMYAQQGQRQKVEQVFQRTRENTYFTDNPIVTMARVREQAIFAGQIKDDSRVYSIWEELKLEWPGNPTTGMAGSRVFFMESEAKND
mgnify:CR=1 FL=1